MPSLLMGTQLPGLFHRGKVRDTHDLGDTLLMITTDRISAFDVVLPIGIPEKGVVLAELSAFWFRQTAHLCPNHFLCMAYEGEEAEGGGLSLPDLGPEVARRAMLVQKAQRVDVECIARGYITGSAWAEYRSSGTVNGQPMPRDLQESQALPEILFTPTTKAEEGHDMPLTLQELEEMLGAELARQLQERTLAIYTWARRFALKRGVILADTKLEFGWIDGQLCIIDELLTPDSSRFWDASLYEPGRPQPSLDKQYVRDWLTETGWNREPPAPPLPQDVVQHTAERYRNIFQRLTGQLLPGLPVPDLPRNYP